MSRITVGWNPKGIRRLSFRNFSVFPISPRRQLSAGLLSVLLIVIGSLAASALPIPNLNMIVFALVGYFMAARVHPHPLVGPAAVTLCVTGVCWTTLMLFPEPLDDLPGTLMVSLAANLFIAMSLGAVLATVLAIDMSTPNNASSGTNSSHCD